MVLSSKEKTQDIYFTQFGQAINGRKKNRFQRGKIFNDSVCSKNGGIRHKISIQNIRTNKESKNKKTLKCGKVHT